MYIGYLFITATRLVSLDLRPRWVYIRVKTRRSRLYAQSPIKPEVLVEKGGLIFARVRYMYSVVCTMMSI